MIFVHSQPKSERQRTLLSSEPHASRAASSNLAPADIDTKITYPSAQIGHHSLHCGQRPCRRFLHLPIDASVYQIAPRDHSANVVALLSAPPRGGPCIP